MRRNARRRFVWFAFTVVLLTGCERVNPQQPSAVPASTASFETAGLTAQAAAKLRPQDLADRGWTCFTPPVPNRIVCSRPNQGFPTASNPPPADRPASFTFFVFDGEGFFVGTEQLIRTDLYRGQTCGPTGEPYVFVPIIGYYECLHPAGAR